MDDILSVSSSFENPCELVRSTCRKWMEEEELVLVVGNDDDDDDDDDKGDDNGDDNGDDGENCCVREWNRNETLRRREDRSSAAAGRRSVRIRHERLPALANEILAQQRQAPIEKTTDGEASWIEWDTEGWHYSGAGFQGTEEERRERVALYLLALDSINFCFWPLPDDDKKHDDVDSAPASTPDSAPDHDPDPASTPVSAPSTDTYTTSNNLLEYEHLAMALKHMAEADHDDNSNNNSNNNNNNKSDQHGYAFSATNLSAVTPETMIDSLRPFLDQQNYPLPNLEKRAELWKEVGEGLLRDYNGSALALLGRAEQNAPRLVELMATSFPGFRDEAYAASQQEQQQQQEQEQQQRLVFLKRAQIFVGDVNAALDLRLTGMERLTTFADYRVPQILRHWGILEYAPGPNGLAAKVDHQIELDPASCDEISIRAATVVGVEELVKVLNRRQTETKGGANDKPKTVFTDVTVDWYLWQVGERMHQEGMMKPFHKVRTHFY